MEQNCYRVLTWEHLHWYYKIGYHILKQKTHGHVFLALFGTYPANLKPLPISGKIQQSETLPSLYLLSAFGNLTSHGLKPWISYPTKTQPSEIPSMAETLGQTIHQAVDYPVRFLHVAPILPVHRLLYLCLSLAVAVESSWLHLRI